MRPLLLLSFLICSICSAQPDLPCRPQDVPEWMQRIGWATKPVPCTLPKREPLHTNAFIGTWSVQKRGGRRFDFWSDKQRVVIQEFDQQGQRKRMYFIDLAANVRMNAHVEGDQAYFLVEDLHLPQVGYFREVWSDSVRATGRTEQILGASCQELLGTDGNNDTTYYWRTGLHPKLFADMRAWAGWLCREGELEYLTTLCEEPAGACLRAQWPKRRFGPEAGGIEVLSIKPGASPMPVLEAKQRFVAEHRFLWMNNTGIGRLPKWMRAYVSDLGPDTLPAAYTPAPQKRDLPDNRFIGTLTAETPTVILGLRDERTGRDTTHRLAKYSYWADARRAVLIMDDPDDEGYLLYAVDLDADVAMATHNEMHSHVVPKLYINTLEEVGLKEFGRGLELDLVPQGVKRTILGRECELYTTPERFVNRFWFPKDEVLNPVFDMKNWMVQRMGQRMKDLMIFGVADRPMPMVVMGTSLTSYKPGVAPPPKADLRYYRVKDERLERKRSRPRGPEVEAVEITEEYLGGHEPEMVVAEPSPPPPAKGSGTGRGPDRAPLGPEMKAWMEATGNKFIGTAKLEFTSVRGERTTVWTVDYASAADRMLIIGRNAQGDITEHTRAYLLDRTARTETLYLPAGDSLRTRNQPLVAHSAPLFPPAYRDTVLTGTRKVLGRSTQHRLYEDTDSRRESWVDATTSNLFQDVFGARRSWSGIEILLRGPMVTSTREGMPLEVVYTFRSDETLTMKVLELKPGVVDPKVFTVSPDSWKR